MDAVAILIISQPGLLSAVEVENRSICLGKGDNCEMDPINCAIVFGGDLSEVEPDKNCVFFTE